MVKMKKLPVNLQVVLGIGCLSCLAGCLTLVLANYDDTPDARFEGRLFSGKQVYSKVLEINFVVFFATMISTSREILLHVVDKQLRRKVSPYLLGLLNVTVKMACLTLFDFRVIHIHNTLIATRYTILVADIASLLLAESIRKECVE